MNHGENSGGIGAIGHREALARLCAAVGETISLAEPSTVIAPSTLAAPYDRLLNHHHHMTTTLSAHFGSDVALRVLTARHDGNDYSRAILLTVGPDGPVVEFGIVRIDLSVLDPDVKSEIVDRRAPLGDILIRHNVFRRIEPRWFLKFEPEAPLMRHFGLPKPVAIYGRIGTIYCNDTPAIDLLEVVADRASS